MAKQFKCSNYGVCPEADKETIFQEVDLEEVDGKYVCPKCGQELEVIEKGGGGKGKLIGIIAAAVVVLGGGAAALLLGGKKDAPEPAPVAMEQPVAEEPAVEEPVVEEPVVEEPAKAPETPKQTPKPTSSTTYNLGWGTYEGPMQGGKPHGMGGEIKVNKAYTIDTKNGASKQVASGDKIVSCKFLNGKLVQGYIHHANGQQESLYIGN